MFVFLSLSSISLIYSSIFLPLCFISLIYSSLFLHLFFTQCLFAFLSLCVSYFPNLPCVIQSSAFTILSLRATSSQPQSFPSLSLASTCLARHQRHYSHHHPHCTTLTHFPPPANGITLLLLPYNNTSNDKKQQHQQKLRQQHPFIFLVSYGLMFYH
ncbi:hypothetical protein E2C01_091796 [Portunus trituberculatus]|uniref:Uncharacterized protein n=1 Tax=Portunus trituberculatus TaxID=210409 RepID=A0A5B7JQ17_PORTR|nr:hypothetical protein [Portunus trituberculatus]